MAQGAIAAGLGIAVAEVAYLFSYFGPTEGFMSDWKGSLPKLDDDGSLVFDQKFISESMIIDIITKTGSFIFLFEGIFHGRNELLPGIISRDAQGVLFASSRKCTHEGCLVEFRDDVVVNSKSYQKVWYCLCHDGVFNANDKGGVLAGPPPSPLQQFDLEVHEGGKKVKLIPR
ncbi:MAG: Rieske 2Fe-2S domain-containing protein [Thermoplasmata archaeon]